jgi:hypothetical protein
MSEVMQRRLMMLLCFRCGNVLETLHETELAFALRISEEELEETKTLFIRKGFIDNDFEVLNWDKRQYASDSSSERVKRHRGKAKERMKSLCNDTETLQKHPQNRTDTDTDTEKKEIAKAISPDIEPKATAKPAAYSEDFERFWKTYPADRKVEKPSAFKVWKIAIKRAAANEIIAGAEWYATSKQVTDGFSCYPAKWLKNERWTESGALPSNLQAQSYTPRHQPTEEERVRGLAQRRDRLGIGDMLFSDIESLNDYEKKHGKMDWKKEA